MTEIEIKQKAEETKRRGDQMRSTLITKPQASMESRMANALAMIAKPGSPAYETAKRERIMRAAEDDAIRKASITERLTSAANVPRLHWTREVSYEVSMPWQKRLSDLTAMLGRQMFIVLCGERGNGKTQIGVELIRHCITSRQAPGRFLVAMEFFIQLRKTMKKDAGQAEDDVVAEFRKPSLLVIDEIGKRGQSEWENNMLFLLLNHRYNDMTDTLLICNLKPGDISESLGPSIMRRVNETGGVIHCDWKI